MISGRKKIRIFSSKLCDFTISFWMEERMKKFCSVFAMFSLVLIPILLIAQEVDVSGDWEMTSQSPRGEMTRALHFDQDGQKIKVTMEGFRGDEITGEGTIEGNKIEWTMTMSTPGGEFTLTYKGTVDGDTMAGTVEMGDRGTRDWTAKKK